MLYITPGSERPVAVRVSGAFPLHSMEPLPQEHVEGNVFILLELEDKLIGLWWSEVKGQLHGCLVFSDHGSPSSLRDIKSDCDGCWTECVSACEAAVGPDSVTHSMQHFSQAE